MTLLDQARETAARRLLMKTPEQQDVAPAWLTDDLSYTQVRSVLPKASKGNSGTYVFLAMALREAFRSGRLAVR